MPPLNIQVKTPNAKAFRDFGSIPHGENPGTFPGGVFMTEEGESFVIKKADKELARLQEGEYTEFNINNALVRLSHRERE